LKKGKLVAAILKAVGECIAINGWQSASGQTGLNTWIRKAKEDGWNVPTSLGRWMAGYGDRNDWTVAPLVELAVIMAAYGVKAGGNPMPPDYFVSILCHGLYKPMDVGGVEKDVAPTLLIKKAIRSMSDAEQLEILAMLSEAVGNRARKAIAKKKDA
jgi:hypothetical protein